jgi:hypothetical protein
LTGQYRDDRIFNGIRGKSQSGTFRRGNCHVKIIKTFARKGGGFYVYGGYNKKKYG